MLASELRLDARWLAAGFLMTFSSGFGQTYVIAIFADDIKAALGLSDGGFGGLYTVSTIASALLLTWVGRTADTFPVRRLAVAMLLGLALTCLLMAASTTLWVLGLAIFGLRFFGQAMLTHVAMTAMGRWFLHKRGRAVAIAGLGYPVGEAMLPLLAVLLLALAGWRGAWLAAGLAILLVPLPVVIMLLARERDSGGENAGRSLLPARREWSRAEVLRLPLFYAALSGVLVVPFIVTAIFFNQVAIVRANGWSLAWYASSFPVLAGFNVVSGLCSGWIVDRVGSRRLLPFFLLPVVLATVLLVLNDHPMVLPLVMALIGVTMGGFGVLQGALWPEMFGTSHLGAIRSIAMAAIVFTSALSPGLTGVLLDAGVSLDLQLLAMAGYGVAASVLMAVLMPRLDRLARG